MPELPGAHEVTEEVYALVLDGKILEAIQLHREQTGAGLAEAKSAIDGIRG
jgi:ribosomal protein L7/L12